MQFSVLQETLLATINDVMRAVEPKTTLPILSYIKLTVKGENLLEVAATDLELGIVRTIGCKNNSFHDGTVPKEYGVALPAKTLQEVVSNLSKERIDFHIDPTTHITKLTCGKAKSNIKGVSHLDYPPLQDSSQAAFQLDAWQLADAINTVSYAVAKEDNRPILTGIHMRLDEDKVWLAAADGFRLAVTFIDLLAAPADKSMSEFVPLGAGMKELYHLLKNCNSRENLRVGFDKDALHFSIENTYVRVMILDGRYPDYEAIIPKRWQTMATLYVEDANKAAKRAKIFARDNADSTLIRLIPPKQAGDAGEAQFAARSRERGDINIAIDSAVTGISNFAYFKNGFLTDALKTVDIERVQILLVDHNSAIVLHPEGSEYPKHLIMPMSGERWEEETSQEMEVVG